MALLPLRRTQAREQHVHRTPILIAGAAFVATLVVAPAFADDGASDDEREHTVERGDTLTAIAEEFSTTWQRLFEENTKLDDPNLILPGQVLIIPPAEPDPEPEPEPEPAPESEPEPEPQTSGAVAGSTWDALAECESNGDWSINTGNGYYGGLQFHPQTWEAHGGHQYAANAHQASREQEIAIAENVLASQGWGAWPACSSALGLR